jgi:hypothetical protein
MKKKPFLLCSLIIVLCSLSGCDLFLNKPENDLLKEIDAAIDYANTARLNAVTVAVPEGWGINNTPVSTIDIRQGYAFELDFTPYTAYGFVKWRAFRTGVLAGSLDWETNPGFLEGGDAAEVVITGGTRASITINTTDPITLVPWCEARPRITLSNPPLINSGISYSRGQEIKIWVATELDPATVHFGPGFIEITGVTIGENSEPFDDPDTTGVNENGDLTGRAAGASKYFRDPVWDSGAKTITIRPGNGEEDTILPPGDVMITVTVGTGVLGANGNGMVSPVSFYYRTNNNIVTNVYTAETIWAIHDPGTASGEESFFYSGADSGRDRRLRKNASEKYEVTLYFSTAASNPVDMTDSPTHVKVVEYHYANLVGDTASTSAGTETVYSLTQENSGAGGIYRTANSGNIPYKITHELQAAAAGIYRLVLLPYRDSGTPDNFDDTGDIRPDTWQNAHADGRYATAVIDNAVPAGNAVITLGGSASTSPEGVYNYSSSSKDMSITANLDGVADNGNVGISTMAASMDRPWTMDDRANLFWQYRIVTLGTANYTSDWFKIGQKTSDTLDLSAVSPSLNEAVTRDIEIRYKDTLDNESGWFNADRRISYFNAATTPVTVWNASYNETDNAITVTWTGPTGMDGVELAYSANGGATTTSTVTGVGTKSYTISNVPKINTSGVLNGQGVSNVYGYTITLTAYTAYGAAAPTTVKIWNIPDMSVNESNLAVEIATQAELAAISVETASAGKNYVLTADITLSGPWTPIGTDTTPFQGKFYGNGRTITVNGSPADRIYTGIFGYVSGATIRDLTVNYQAAATAGTNATRAGGIAGQADGNTVIKNCIVSGGGTFSGANAQYVGGIAGYMQGTVKIENCRSGLNVVGTQYVGGAVGYIASGGTSTVAYVSDVTVTGNVNVTGSGLFWAGGLAGKSQTSGTIQNVTVSGTIRMANTSGPAQSLADEPATLPVTLVESSVGGVMGRMLNGKLYECEFTGKLETTAQYSITHGVLVGGLTGDVAFNAAIEECVVRGDITITETGSGSISLGGMSGGAVNASFTNCEYRDGLITVDTSGSIGGFISGANGNVTMTNCRVLASAITMTVRGGRHGGFVALGRGNMSNCYSNTDLDVIVTGSGTDLIRVGGFTAEYETDVTGGSNADWTIESCYAAGNVTVRSESGYTEALRVGGFIGILGHYNYTQSDAYKDTHIKNCYALGNVTVTRVTGGDISAGGFAGMVNIQNVNVLEHCFATGAVLAISNDSTGAVHAGGLVGRNHLGTVKFSAALGPSVTALGGSSRAVGRVVGFNNSTVSNNYALGTMLLEIDASATTLTPGTQTVASPPVNRDGGSVSASLFRNQSTWTGTLGFPASTWNFSGVSRGYPALAGLGGQ